MLDFHTIQEPYKFEAFAYSKIVVLYSNVYINEYNHKTFVTATAKYAVYLI